jgi:hypothetical protein
MLGFEAGFSFLLRSYTESKNKINNNIKNSKPLRLLYIDSFYYNSLLNDFSLVKNMDEDQKLKVKNIVEKSIKTSNDIKKQEELGQIIEMDEKVQRFEEKCKTVNKFVKIELAEWIPMDFKDKFINEIQSIFDSDAESFIQLYMKYFKEKIISYYDFIALFECTMLWILSQDLTSA